MGQYDILVRHIAHRQAHAMAQGLLSGTQVQSARWMDTQLTAVRERRADKALELETGDGPGLLKVEFAVDPGRSIFFRMFEYGALTIIAQHAARSGVTARPMPSPSGAPTHHVTCNAADLHRPGAPPIPAEPDAEEHAAPEPLHPVLFILRGSKTPWPAEGRYRTSPPGTPFSGQRFRIEAVYQRTVDELMTRPGSFWLAFTSLAVDANVEKMRQVIDEIRLREPCEEDRDELYLTLLTLAELDPWGHHLYEEIKAMLLTPEMQETMKSRWVREVVAMNREEALEEGWEKGQHALIEEMLRHQLVRHLRRDLTPAEQQALSARAETLSGPEVAELLAHSDSLLSRLFGPTSDTGG